MHDDELEEDLKDYQVHGHDVQLHDVDMITVDDDEVIDFHDIVIEKIE